MAVIWYNAADGFAATDGCYVHMVSHERVAG